MDDHNQNFTQRRAPDKHKNEVNPKYEPEPEPNDVNLIDQKPYPKSKIFRHFLLIRNSIRTGKF